MFGLAVANNITMSRCNFNKSRTLKLHKIMGSPLQSIQTCFLSSSQTLIPCDVIGPLDQRHKF